MLAETASCGGGIDGGAMFPDYSLSDWEMPAVKRCVIGGLEISFSGSLPSHPSVLIASDAAASGEAAAWLYRAALEASLSGYAVIAEADTSGPDSIICGTEDGRGRLFLSVSSSAEEYMERYQRKAMRIVSAGGGIIGRSRRWSCSREEAWETAARLADMALLAMLGDTPFPAAAALLMLDEGKEVAVTKSSLQSECGRAFALDGCPVADSFSSIIASPSAISYPSRSGLYAFGSSRYDVLRFE